MYRQHKPNKKDRPDPQSQNGALLAAMMCGEWVSSTQVLGHNDVGKTIEYLRSSYDMEILSKRGRGGGVRLLGEWDGPYFVPVERMRPYPEPEDYRQPKN